MPKPRSDSVLDGLPENQRAAIERWLFEENLSHKDTAVRIFQDFAVRISPSAVACFYQRCAKRRMLLQIAASSESSKAVTDQFRQNPDTSFEALLGLIGQAAFEMKLQSGGKLDLKTLKDLAEIMALGLKVKTDTKKIAQKDEQLRLQRDKLEIDVTKLAMKEAAFIKSVSSNSKLTESEKMNVIRQKLFGQLPPPATT